MRTPLLRACERCGVVRQVHPSRPAPLCRDCRPPEANANPRHPCDLCGRLITSGNMARHRGRKWCTRTKGDG